MPYRGEFRVRWCEPAEWSLNMVRLIVEAGVVRFDMRGRDDGGEFVIRAGRAVQRPDGKYTGQCVYRYDTDGSERNARLVLQVVKGDATCHVDGTWYDESGDEWFFDAELEREVVPTDC